MIARAVCVSRASRGTTAPGLVVGSDVAKFLKEVREIRSHWVYWIIRVVRMFRGIRLIGLVRRGR